MLKRFFTGLCQLFIVPENTDEDLYRREFILNIILGSSIILLTISTLLVVYNTLRLGQAYAGIPWYAIAGILAVFASLLILSRKGLHKISSYVLICIYLLSISTAIYLWGPDLPTALLSYALVIVIASILISTNFGFLVTIVISTIVTLLSYFESILLLRPSLEWKIETLGIYDGIAFAAIFSMIMIVSWLSNREIERSLQRARRSEQALKAERDSLEMRVERRTEELHHLQLQRVTELLHFAELGKLATGFFHDLMNPLTALTLAVEQFDITKTSNKNVMTEQLDRALLASKRVGELITALRHYGTLTTELQILSLNAELRRITNLLDFEARKYQIKLELQATQEITLSINPYTFYNIIHNLIVFSIEEARIFTSNLDRVIIILLHHREAEVLLEIIYPGDRLPTFTESENSQDLSLVITKNLLEKLNGTLKIKRSKPDRIVVVTASFPEIT